MSTHPHGSKSRWVFLLTLCSILILPGCSDPKPDGHAYVMNGLGITLPASGIEITYLPYNTRAEFFHEPLSEAYTYTTTGLSASLQPLCAEANEIIARQTDELDLARQQLLQSGNVPDTADACLNMCTSRISFEAQRENDRKTLIQTHAALDQQIAAAKQKMKDLQASRAKKSGQLGNRLAALRSERTHALNTAAEQLLARQLEKVTFAVGLRQLRYYSLYHGAKISVELNNNTEFALASAQYSNQPVLAGYYNGEEIKRYSDVQLPGYGHKGTTKDSLGFDKHYAVGPGESVRLGVGIDDFEGLDMNSPSGRLMALEKGWTPNSKGYILPDEIRIVNFPADLFLIPDETGQRQGASIVYSPKPVDFKQQAAAQGLPQDSEIARISRQLSNQSYPEDEQIAALEGEISQHLADKKSATNAFNSSSVAQSINALVESESLCRTARDQMNDLDQWGKLLSEQQSNLASCATENVNTGAIYGAIYSVNREYDEGIELPNIQEKYAAKAKQLIWAKLATEAQFGSRSNIDGAFNIDESIDQEQSLVFATWASSLGDLFWMQPLSTLGTNKDLNHDLARQGPIDEYFDDVVARSCSGCSLEEFSTWISNAGLAAPNPNQLAGLFSLNEMRAARQLEMLETMDSGTGLAETNEVQVATLPGQACKI